MINRYHTEVDRISRFDSIFASDYGVIGLETLDDAYLFDNQSD